MKQSTTYAPPNLRPGLWWGAWPGLAAMALLGSSVAVIAATQHLPVFAVQAARYAVAAVALVALGRALGIRLVLPRLADIGWVVGGAATGLVGFNLATILGTRHAEPALLGASVACVPMALALAGPLIERRRPSMRTVLGAAVVGAGAVAVTGWGRGDAIGIAMAVALIACEVGFTLFGARALPRMGAWSYSAATAVVAAVAFAGLAAFTERPDLRSFASGETIGAIVYLGAIATALAFVLWFTGVQRLGPGAAGLCAGAAAPASALIGAALGAPMPTLGTWAGIAVVAVGLAIGFAPRRAPAAPEPESALAPSPEPTSEPEPEVVRAS